MKLSQWSWSFGILSYVILGVVRRSGFPTEGLFLGAPGLIMFVLLLLLAGIGIVIGVLSWKRKELKAWWAFDSIAPNIIMALAGISLELEG